MALTVQKVLSFVYFAYISKSVGSEEIGRYLFALSLTTIFGILIDVGLSPVLTRETAKDRAQTPQLLNSAISVKIITSIIAYLAVIATVTIIGAPELTRQLVMVSGIIMILDSFTLSFYAVLRGHQILKYEAIGTIVNKIVVMSIGIVALKMGYGVMVLVVAILFGSSFNFFYSLGLLIKRVTWRPSLGWHRPVLRRIVMIALPFALASVFTTVFGYVDTVLLNIMSGDRGNSYVGWYGTAYKLTYAFQFIPIAVSAAVFPAMSSYFVSSRELLARTFERAIYYLMVIVMPIAFGVFAIADSLILGVWGEAFEASIRPLQILIFSLVFIFLNFPVGALLNAANRQMRNTMNIGLAMTVNVIANLILIPQLNFIGTSVASLISTVVLWAAGMWVVGQIIDFDRAFILKTAARTVGAAIVMTAIIFALKPELHFTLLIPLGIVTYFAALIAFRGFGRSEFRKIYSAVMKKIA